MPFRMLRVRIAFQATMGLQKRHQNARKLLFYNALDTSNDDGISIALVSGMPDLHSPLPAALRGRSARRGFTLIELLIVVCIIAILASIAIPKFKNTKGKAYATTLRADLRNLATAEEAYFYDNDVYSTTLGGLQYSSSPGVVVNITTATAVGWSASATHPAASPLTCALFVGPVTPAVPAVVEGVTACQ
jgi:type IV pilus assembly protein PilA